MRSGGAFAAVALASALACVVTTVGIIAVSRYARRASDYAAYFMSYAAGVILSVAFTHIIPASFSLSQGAPVGVLAGFMAMYVTNRFLRAYVCHERDDTDHSLGIIPMLGIGLHSLVDGVIYSVTFNFSILTGALAAIGMVLHEFPEGVVTFVLLQRGGFGTMRSAVYAFLAAAFTTPLGALVSFPFLGRITRAALGNLLAASAGALVYVGASHLLPAVEKENRKYSLLALGAGVLTAAVIVISKG